MPRTPQHVRQRARKKSVKARKKKPFVRQQPVVASPYCMIDEGAAYIRISRRKAYKLINERLIPSYLIDGRRLLKYRDLDAYMESLPQAPPPSVAPSPQYRNNTKHHKQLAAVEATPSTE